LRVGRRDVIGVVAVGGALGALARYGLSVWLPGSPGSIPWATLAANVSGCLLIGILMVSLTETSRRPHRLVRPFLGVGVLGGFTTFSTYVMETQQLASAGAPRLAALYLFGTLAAALVAVQVGIVATRVAVGVGTRRGAGSP
jgi:CrcB protein